MSEMDDTPEGGSIFTFNRATRKAKRIVIVLYAMSEGGKTFSALHLARGIVGDDKDIALIDTEGRAELYANEAGGFLHADLQEPWTPERYVQALTDAGKLSNVGVIIIDSGSHEWDDVGGVLDAAAANPNKGLLTWQRPKMRHKKFMQAIARCRVPLIICLRAKPKIVEEMVEGENGRKKKEIVTKGIVPIQSKDFKYDVTVMLEMTGNGNFRVEKCPKDLRDTFDESQKVSIEMGKAMGKWIAGAVAVDHDFETFKTMAEDIAATGMEALKAWFTGAADEDKREKITRQKRAQPLMPNLKSIAEAADTRAAQEKADAEQFARENGDPAPVEAPEWMAARMAVLSTLEEFKDVGDWIEDTSDWIKTHLTLTNDDKALGRRVVAEAAKSRMNYLATKD